MIRFIDLRGQDTGYEFAFFDTVTTTFVAVSGVHAFESVVLDAGLEPAAHRFDPGVGPDD